MNGKLDSVDLKYWLGPFLLARQSLPASIVETDWRASPEEALGASPTGCKQDSILYYPSSPIAQDTPDITNFGHAIRYIEKRFWRHSTDLTLSMDDYWQTFSGKTRSTLKRKLRKFEAETGGPADIRLFRTPEEIETFFNIAGEISSKTYQERLYDAGLPRSSAFRKEMISEAVSGQVAGFILYLGDTAIAYLFCPIKDGRVIYQFLGFDPAYAMLSPGTVLQMKAFEYLMADPTCILFDFTDGDGAHKRLFATASHYCANVFFLPNTFKNRSMIRLHHTLAGLSNLADKTLSRLRIKQRLKKLLRRQV